VTPSWKGWVVAFAVVPAFVLGATTTVSSAPATAAPTASASQVEGWYQKVLTDLSPLQTNLVGSLQAAQSWQQGSESAAAARRQLTRALPTLEAVVHSVASLAPLPGYAGVRSDYVDAVELYLEAFHLEQAATNVSNRPLVRQLQLSYQRIRELGDVTFDQGTALLAPDLGATVAGADTAAASHIPVWSTVGLAPGLPLVSSWPDTTTAAVGTQSMSDWSSAVARADLPAQSSVARALTRKAPTSAALAGLAGALVRAETSVSAIAPPAGSPQASQLLRLGLLADAEAVLAEEARVLSSSASSSALGQVAPALESIGSDLRTGA
jgi:hypothetical protein